MSKTALIVGGTGQIGRAVAPALIADGWRVGARQRPQAGQAPLDGGGLTPPAYVGQSRFHTSATRNIAELIRVVLAAPATQVLNAADPAAPTVTQIGETIGRIYGWRGRLVPFDGAPAGSVGASPWSVPLPFVVDMARAKAL